MCRVRVGLKKNKKKTKMTKITQRHDLWSDIKYIPVASQAIKC